MYKRVVQVCIVCLALFITSELQAATEVVAKITPLIMGGSSLGLRNSSKQDAEIAFNVALGELIAPFGSRPVVKIYATTDALYAAFDKGEINGIFGTPIEYLGRENRLGKIMMAVGYENVPLKQSFVILVRKDDGIYQVKDLKNKQLTLAKYQDTEAVYLNTLLLKNQLSEIPTFFAVRHDAKNSNVAIMAVFFNKSDATIVSESEYKIAVELNPQIGKKLIVLEKSPPYLSLVGGVRNEIVADEYAGLVEIVQQSTGNVKGKNILNLIHASSIQPVSNEDLQGVRDLLKEYKALQKLNSGLAIAAALKPKVKPSAQ